MIEELFVTLRRKHRAGLLAMARRVAEVYRERVSQTVLDPEITEDGRIFFPGEPSSPGEFPFRRTGQGASNIDYGISPSEDIAQAGIRGEETGFGPFPGNSHVGGMHLQYLANRGWLGLDDVFAELQGELPQIYQQAANGVQ